MNTNKNEVLMQLAPRDLNRSQESVYSVETYLESIDDRSNESIQHMIHVFV